MKKTKLLLVLLLIPVLILTSCKKTTNISSNSLKIEGISVNTDKADTYFSIGVDFSYDGIVVYINYSDGTKVETKDYAISYSNYNKNMPGPYDIVIKYSDNGTLYSTTYQVKVLDTNTIKSIEVDLDNTKVFYLPGEDLTNDDIIVKALRETGDIETIDSYTIDKGTFNKDVPGTYLIKIVLNYGEKILTAEYEVTVGSILNVIKHIKGIDVMPRNKEFLKGTPYSKEDLVVMAVYSDGTEEDITDKVTVDSSKYKKDEVGVYEIIVSYNETYTYNGITEEMLYDSFYFARVVNEYSGGTN